MPAPTPSFSLAKIEATDTKDKSGYYLRLWLESHADSVEFVDRVFCTQVNENGWDEAPRTFNFRRDIMPGQQVRSDQRFFYNFARLEFDTADFCFDLSYSLRITRPDPDFFWRPLHVDLKKRPRQKGDLRPLL